MPISCLRSRVYFPAVLRSPDHTLKNDSIARSSLEAGGKQPHNNLRLGFGVRWQGLKMRLIVIFFVSLVIGGCRIVVVTPNTGSVVSDESGSCPPAHRCTLDVYDTFFSDAFVAVPNEGYEFVGWKKRDRGLCGGNIGPCELSTGNMAGNDTLIAVLESDEEFYLEPVFRPIPISPPPSQHLLLYGGVYYEEFIGCLTCGKSNIDSVCNAQGNYGSSYAFYSIWNEFGDYGSPYSDLSPWNRYADTPPAIYDNLGNFYGYLTANTLLPNRTNHPTLIQLSDYGGSGQYSLNTVRDWFCE